MVSLAGAVLAVVLLASCAGAPSGAPDQEPAGEPASRQRYEVTALVLEDASHGPMLCPGGIALSDPPQCGNVPITNWDWDAVGGEKRKTGTIWGSYRVVGTYDGEAFTVTGVGRAGKTPSPFDEGPIEAGCPEPDGGWAWPDPGRASEDDFAAAQRMAQREPDFAGLWIDHLKDPNPDAPSDARQIVISAAFTGDLERHEAELREAWGGPLCLVEHPRSYRDLRVIQKELSPGRKGNLGLQILGSSIDVVNNVVEVHVVLLDDEDQEALDERYGKGTVQATSALTPID
jgi:hypothetical protein